MKNRVIARRAASSFPITIYIAGDVSAARAACRSFCFEHGLCVTVVEADYVYTGGAETGVAVGPINYPRFPKSEDDLVGQAEQLARQLLDDLCQGSCTIQTSVDTIWLSRRGE